MAGEAELAFVATMRDEASSAARTARKTLDSIGGPTKPITTALEVKADADEALRVLDQLPKNARGTVHQTSEEFRALSPAMRHAILGVEQEAAVGAAKAAAAIRDEIGGLEPKLREEGEDGGRGISAGIVAGIDAGKAAVVGAAVAVGAAFASSLGDAIGQEAATDRLAAALGAGPALAKRYGDMAGRIYAGAWGESIEDVTGAIESVKSSIRGLGSGAELEAATTRALDFATVFEVDVARAAQVAGQAVRLGLAKDATEAFDLLTAASSAVPAALREDVLDASDEYGQFFAQLGYDGAAAFSVLAAGGEKGMYGIDKAGDAVKEFTIRATDMSTASVDAYKAIGLDAQTMANRILAGGDTAKGATDKIIKGILGIQDPAKRANTAIALFGTPLEDLGTKDIPKFLRSLTGASDVLGKVEGASTRAGKTLNDNAQTNLTAFGRAAKQQIVDVLGGTVVPILNDVAAAASSKLGPGFDAAGAAIGSVTGFLREHKAIAVGLVAVIGALTAVTAAHSAVLAVSAAGGMAAWIRGTKIVSALTKVWAAVQWALNAAMYANPIGLAVLAIVALIAAVVLAWKHSETFRTVVIAVWNAIKGAVSSAVGAVTNAIGAAWGWIKSATAKVWGWIKGATVGAWNAIRNGVSKAIDGVRSVVSKVFAWIRLYIAVTVKVWRTLITNAWNAIKGAVTAAINAVRSTVSSSFNAIKSVISGAMSTARSIIGKAWDAIKRAFTEGVTKAVNVAKDLGSKVKGAISGFIGDMFSVGKDLIMGLINGIGAFAGQLVDKVKGVVEGAKNKAKALLGIASPSKVFAYLGKMTIAGFIKGITGGGKALNKTLDRVFGGISKVVRSRYKSAKEGKRIARMVIRNLKEEEVAAIRANRAAEARLKGFRTRARKIVADVAANAQKLATIEAPNDAPMTAGFIVKGFADRLKAIQTFAANLDKARRAGLDRRFVEEIAAQGVEAGGAYAAALASATPDQVKAINASRAQLAKAAGGVGDAVTGGISQELRKVAKAGERLANALLRGIRDRLQIDGGKGKGGKGRKGGGRDAGRRHAENVAKGIRDGQAKAARAARDTADRVRAASVVPATELSRLANDAASVSPVLRSSETVTIRHEVVSPDGSVSDKTAGEIADLIARDPKASAALERALRPVRRRNQSRTLNASR